MQYGGMILWIATIFLTLLPANQSSLFAQEFTTVNSENNKLVAATKPQIANTARDGNIAIAEEFELLAARNTVEAMELFIARHPNHKLSQEAAKRIKLYRAKTIRE